MPVARCVVVLAVGLALVLSPGATRSVQAAEPSKAPVDDISSVLAESVQKHKLPSMAAAVVEDGHITAIGAAGVRRRGHKEPITADDLFHIGSDTKSMTATLIAVLVEEGKLRWNSTPAEVFAGTVKEIDPAWKHVTLEELLTHRAGVRPDPDLILFGALGLSPREQRLRVCRSVLRKPPDHQPGKAFLYSNTGYMIAGAVAEVVADDSWENLMRHRVFKPLGIEHAGFGPPGMPPARTAKDSPTASSAPISQPWGHLSNGEAVRPGPDADNPACYGPAGCVHLPLADWARYAVLHLSEGQGSQTDSRAAGTKLLLPVAALRKLHTPFGDAIDRSGTKYAMGWAVRKLPGSGVGIELTHSGSNTMWYAVISLRMSEKHAILIATNQGGPGAGAACGEVKAALLRRLKSAHAGRN
ncbi:MAG TPA: serine hydrolase domain-containing protein [Planctomycetaceae bacterium]|jgi:CubicO group peptidase (beta-lactamase class C family)|nr:serine hydrolase domain-containing protein [Planctomycetaceae bacterium]